MTDYQGAQREALKNAAQRIKDLVADKSPSARIAAAWRVYRRGESYRLRNGEISAVATNDNFRHPYWGDRKHWAATNDRNPSRSHWAEHAAEDAIKAAEDEFRGDYIKHIAATSRIFQLGK